MSESLAKVQNFQNRKALGVDQSTVEFVLGKSGYDELMSSSVNQLGSRRVDAIKYNFEGIFPTWEQTAGPHQVVSSALGQPKPG